MDKVIRYRQVVQQILEDYAQRMSRGNRVQILPVCDPVHDQYLLISLGWQNKRREHAIVFHAQLRQGQFFVEDDRTEEGIGNKLLEAGVPQEDIRLAWADPSQPKDEVPLVA